MTASPLGRLVEIAEDGRHLSKADGFLVIKMGHEEIGRIPLDDITAVIATAPGTTISCAALAELALRGIPFAVCGRNFVPAGLLWPLAGHHAQQRRMECQISAGLPLKKRLWAMLIAAKIKRQGAVLSNCGVNAEAFNALARSVRSGDPDNIEAQAARRYWPALFGLGFRRDQDADGANAMLNYGYAVLRAAAARAIVAAGLHPGIGIFHRHPQNAMPLTDDLMEPFRPIVDRQVFDLVGTGHGAVTPPVKRRLAAVLQVDLLTAAGRTPVSTCLHRLAGSLGESFIANVPDLELSFSLPIAVHDREDETDALS